MLLGADVRLRMEWSGVDRPLKNWAQRGLLEGGNKGADNS